MSWVDQIATQGALEKWREVPMVSVGSVAPSYTLSILCSFISRLPGGISELL